MSARVFLTRRPPDEVLAELEAAPEVEEVVLHPHDRPVTRRELLDGVRRCDAVIAQLVDRIDAEVLDAKPGLRVVANYAVGYDNVDVAAATARGVPVTNTPDVLTEATAELTWALLLAVARRVVEGDRCMREGRYPGWSPTFMLGTELYGKTLGVVGLGRIGTAVARRAAAFGMRVLYTSRAAKAHAADLGAERVSLERLLAEADAVTIHCPLTDATRHLFDRERLRAMKPTAFLVNTSRGPVVDEAALVEALRERRIAGAGLDVYEREPAMAPGLAELESAVLLPHLGSATRETRIAMGCTAARNVIDVFAGRRPRTCVNPEVLDAAGG